MSSYYPEDMTGAGICYIEGHLGNGHCPRCGDTNYHLLGYYGAIARWAKAWGVTTAEAEARMEHKATQAWAKEQHV